jgi:DNA-binding transcriptional ArsR family regulator
VIEIVLSHMDLGRIRFAHSPVSEIVASLRILRDRAMRQVYGRWMSALRGRLGGVDLELLLALAPTGRYLPDFVLPPPRLPWGILAEELAELAATPPALVRADLELVYSDRPMPAVLRPLYDNPARHLTSVADAMHRYWQAAIEPVRPRLEALCRADLAYRMSRFATDGIASMLADLHPEVSLHDDRLCIDKPQHREHRFHLTGSGILLVPCAFTWPRLTVRCCGRADPMLIYPPNGVAGLCAPTAGRQREPLRALVGRTRAALLAALDLPRTTTQLAHELDISPASVSQHLKILHQSALVTAGRQGRMVFYQRTDTASALLKTIQATTTIERSARHL